MVKDLTASVPQTGMHEFISYPQSNACYLGSCFHGQFEVNI